MPATGFPRLRCPACAASLGAAGNSPLRCPTCGQEYGHTGGIPALLVAHSSPAWRGYFDSLPSGPARHEPGYAPEGVPGAGLQLRILARAFARAASRWIPAGARILDVGCGRGSLLAPLAQRHSLFGVDFSPAMLARARERGYRVFQADALALPFESGQFEAVVCAEVVQVVDDPARLLAELARVCRAGGCVMVSTLNRRSMLRKAYRAIQSRIRPGPFRLPIRSRSPTELVKAAPAALLESAGVAWVLSPSRQVVFTAALDGQVAPLASNFILCFRRPRAAGDAG